MNPLKTTVIIISRMDTLMIIRNIYCSRRHLALLNEEQPDYCCYLQSFYLTFKRFLISGQRVKVRHISFQLLVECKVTCLQFLTACYFFWYLKMNIQIQVYLFVWCLTASQHRILNTLRNVTQWYQSLFVQHLMILSEVIYSCIIFYN